MGMDFRPKPNDADGTPLVKLSTKYDDDNKQIIVPSPATEGWLTYFTGAGDDPNPTPPDSGRGTGTQILVDFHGTVCSGNWTWDGTTTVLTDDTSDVAVDDYIWYECHGYLWPFRVITVTEDTSVIIDQGGAPRIPKGSAEETHRWRTGVDDVAKTIEFDFIEPVEVHDGELFYSPSVDTAVPNWSHHDIWSLGVRMPATAVTPNGAGTGNCTVVNGYVVVPAPGNGDYDVNLDNAVPVSADGAGFWDVDYETGAVTPSATPGQAKFHLLLVEVKAYLLRNIPMGHPLGNFDLDVYKTEWIHQNHILRLEIKKVTPGCGEAAGWLMLFRKHIT